MIGDERLSAAKAALLKRLQVEPLTLDATRWVCAWRSAENHHSAGPPLWDTAELFYEGDVGTKNQPLAALVEEVYVNVDAQSAAADLDAVTVELEECLRRIRESGNKFPMLDDSYHPVSFTTRPPWER